MALVTGLVPRGGCATPSIGLRFPPLSLCIHWEYNYYIKLVEPVNTFNSTHPHTHTHRKPLINLMKLNVLEGTPIGTAGQSKSRSPVPRPHTYNKKPALSHLKGVYCATMWYIKMLLCDYLLFICDILKFFLDF